MNSRPAINNSWPRVTPLRAWYRISPQHFTALGLAPSPITARAAIEHEVFTLREPAGYVFTV